MAGFIECLARMPKADQEKKVRYRIMETSPLIAGTAEFNEIIADWSAHDGADWEIGGCEVLKYKVLDKEVHVVVGFAAYKLGNEDEHDPSSPDQFKGKTTAVIDDDARVQYETVCRRGRSAASTATSESRRLAKKSRRAKSAEPDLPVGSLQWIEYYVHLRWKQANTGSEALWVKIGGYAVAVGRDKLHNASDWRYGVENARGGTIIWDTTHTYPSEESAKRAALLELARILLRP